MIATHINKVNVMNYYQKIRESIKASVKIYRPHHSMCKSDCWLWIKRRNAGGTGYGIYRDGEGAHRASYRAFVLEGAIPNRMLVLHTCDVKRCVNPDHLYLGTAKDNMRDLALRGSNLEPCEH